MILQIFQSNNYMLILLSHSLRKRVVVVSSQYTSGSIPLRRTWAIPMGNVRELLEILEFLMIRGHFYMLAQEGNTCLKL